MSIQVSYPVILQFRPLSIYLPSLYIIGLTQCTSSFHNGPNSYKKRDSLAKSLVEECGVNDVIDFWEEFGS